MSLPNIRDVRTLLESTSILLSFCQKSEIKRYIGYKIYLEFDLYRIWKRYQWIIKRDQLPKLPRFICMRITLLTFHVSFYFLSVFIRNMLSKFFEVESHSKEWKFYHFFSRVTEFSTFKSEISLLFFMIRFHSKEFREYISYFNRSTENKSNDMNTWKIYLLYISFVY